MATMLESLCQGLVDSERTLSPLPLLALDPGARLLIDIAKDWHAYKGDTQAHAMTWNSHHGLIESTPSCIERRRV
jgi:hypothetical protein